MAKRRKLSDLVKEEIQRPEVTDLETSEVREEKIDEAANLQAPEVRELQNDGVNPSQIVEVTGVRTAQLTDSRSAASHRDGERASAPVEQVPKYLTLIRKETRLREDQLDRLTTIARKLNRTKRGGERITENTLIRVAVDLLLARATSLSGVTEAELRDSLSWEETD